MIRRLKLLFAVLVIAQPMYATVHTVGLDKSQFTSDFMMGDVVVSVIFPESNGSKDPNTENWSDDRKTQALSKIMSGLDWWTKQNQKSPLRFTFVSQTVSCDYEPITRPYYDEALWIPNVMTRLGYSGSRFTSVRQYCNALRDQYKTDWAYVIFVVDSLSDANGKFADGLFAYSYLGGPFTVMTYDNNGYGIANMDVVIAHETGHIFNALDEYAGASSPDSYSSGYYPTINGNHVYSPAANEPNSIMRGGIRWGLDSWAKRMIGWVDDNNNDVDDINDVTPTTTLNAQSASVNSNGYSFSGHTSLNVRPRQQNPSGNGMTIDSITDVEYKLKNDEWTHASAVDGKFDSVQEDFVFNIPPSKLSKAQSLTAQDVDIRVVTAYSNGVTGNSGGNSGGSGAISLSLDDAHAYPNPFKPNSNLGHTDVTFKGLTANAKVQVFTPAGEPVYEKTNTTGTDQISWPAENDAGVKVASGIYYYLITDPLGHTKKGKLAILR